jgi:uncharacterized protein (DUF433 family)
MEAALAERIVIDPSRAAEGPFVRNTGLSVDQVLKALAQQPDVAAVLAAFPALELVDVQAAIEYAREAVTTREQTQAVRYIADIGWAPDYAAKLRWRLQSFAEDWDDPSMDIYDAPPAR